MNNRQIYPDLAEAGGKKKIKKTPQNLFNAECKRDN